jgi:hypothetical protein
LIRDEVGTVMSTVVSNDSHFDNLEVIKKIESPILFIHEESSSVQIRHSEELYKKAQNILNKLIICNTETNNSDDFC